MKFVLYGLPCAGKDYLLEHLPFLFHIKGSAWLNDQCDGKFRSLSSDKQDELRKDFIEYVRTCNKNLIVDGHYSFPSENGFTKVFTESDGDCYDVFIYMDTPAEIIYERIQSSEKNQIYSQISIEDIKKWKEYEISSLFNEVLVRGKEFLLLDSDIEEFAEFLKGVIEHKFLLAPEVSRMAADRIMAATTSKIIVLSDGDKTLTVSDLTKSVPVPEDMKRKGIFDGDKYTTYQFWKARKAHSSLSDLPERINVAVQGAEFYAPLLEDLSHIRGYKVIVSAGLEDLWALAAEKSGVMDMAIGSDSKGLRNMSQLGKAYLARYLKDAGRTIVALGDNMVDYYMLIEADNGYVIAHAKKNNSLQNKIRNGTKLKQPASNQVKFEGVKEVVSIHEDIE